MVAESSFPYCPSICYGNLFYNTSLWQSWSICWFTILLTPPLPHPHTFHESPVPVPISWSQLWTPMKYVWVCVCMCVSICVQWQYSNGSIVEGGIMCKLKAGALSRPWLLLYCQVHWYICSIYCYSPETAVGLCKVGQSVQYGFKAHSCDRSWSTWFVEGNTTINPT